MKSKRFVSMHAVVHHLQPLHQRQRGVVLVIALILVLIMSLLGTAAIRNATYSERSISGLRSADVAREAAETALRFCEEIAIFDAEDKDYNEWGTSGLRQKIVEITVKSETDNDAVWRKAENWQNNSARIDVPAAYYKRQSGAGAASDGSQLKTAPVCVIQRLRTTYDPVLEGYLITARGFANNARFNGSTGKTTQGAEAWMQSVLTRPS